jgi:hypothetical protein
MNILGALGLIMSGTYLTDLPSVFLNVAWLLIACIAILRLIWKSLRKERPAD